MTGLEYKELRQSADMTQLQVAIALEVDPSTIQRREREGVPFEQELALRAVIEQREAAATGAS